MWAIDGPAPLDVQRQYCFDRSKDKKILASVPEVSEEDFELQASRLTFFSAARAANTFFLSFFLS